MSLLLRNLSTKPEIDSAIRKTADKVVVLRFGRENELVCMQLDEILSKASPLLAKMCEIFIVEVDSVPTYRDYFDITLTPATIFFFNAQHIKVDSNTPDHSKFIGTFRNKQDFIDLVEVVYRGAMKGKVMVTSPIPHSDITKYELLYKNI